jgi:hypothetical protein
MKPPKVFISYSWSSPKHRDRIRSYAERLITDKVEVTLDQWELSDGRVKYAFIDKMVSDSQITHVLVFSDQQYCEKADAGTAGGGTESQIVTQDIYFNVQQEKFIPIVCQMRENGEPYLPVFLKSRIWIDFSTPEKVDANWGRLLRVLFDKTMAGSSRKKTMTYSNTSLPITILIAIILWGGFYYATESDKQKSIEQIKAMEIAEGSKIEAMKIAEKRRLEEKAYSIRMAELQIRKYCDISAQNTAVELYKNFCTYNPSYCPAYRKGAYVVKDYQKAYSTCLQSYGL